MPVEFRKRITRDMLRAEPGKLFIFGDNFKRRGFGGQAREMRGEPNAIGLPTKRAPDMFADAFFTDLDLHLVIQRTAEDVKRLRAHIAKGGVIVWPEDGIGTGLARLEQSAPAIRAWYDRLLKELCNGN